MQKDQRTQIDNQNERLESWIEARERSQEIRRDWEEKGKNYHENWDRVPEETSQLHDSRKPRKDTYFGREVLDEIGLSSGQRNDINRFDRVFFGVVLLLT